MRPRTTLLLAVRGAFAVMGAVPVKVVTAFTVSDCELLTPNVTLPLAVRLALAVMGAVVAKVVTAFTVRV